MADDYDQRVLPLIEQLLVVVRPAERDAAVCALGTVLSAIIRDAHPPFRERILQGVIDALREDVRRA